MSEDKKNIDEAVINAEKDNENSPADIGKKINLNPTSADKNDARVIIQKLRGIPVGRKVDLTAERVTNIVDSSPENLSTILKNDLDELVYITETTDGNVIITSVSKKRYIKRDTILLARSVQFLRRFLVQV